MQICNNHKAANLAQPSIYRPQPLFLFKGRGVGTRIAHTGPIYNSAQFFKKAIMSHEIIIMI